MGKQRSTKAKLAIIVICCLMYLLMQICMIIFTSREAGDDVFESLAAGAGGKGRALLHQLQHQPRHGRGDPAPDPGIEVAARLEAASLRRPQAPQARHHPRQGTS